MKKICIIILSLMLFFPITTLAAGSISVSTSSIKLYKGETKTFTITANNAVGRIDLQTSGSISINSTSHWLENNSVTIKVTGNNVGTSKISVKISDAATFDEEELSGTKTITVNVIEKTSGGINTTKKTTKRTTTNNLSKNTKLKTISVKGYELNKKDGEYFLSVDNNITKIEIDATTEDKLSKISGIGEKELNVGPNIFDVIVTSESGKKETYKINITRKDGFYLEDLDNLLKSDSTSLIIKENEILKKEHLDKIKKSKKEITLNYFKDGQNIYTWIINGKKVNETTKIDTNITFNSSNLEKLLTKANYADGIILNFKHEGRLPDDTQLKIYVGDKYKDNEKVNLYYNAEEELELVEKEIKVKDGYITFDLEHCSEYFVTKANINNTSNYSLLIISIIEFVIILILTILYVKKLKK